MGRDYGDGIRLRATAIVIRETRLLLLKGEPQDAGFHLPGGGVQPGEPPASAMARELLEETGLRASEIERLFNHYEHWGDESVRFSGQDHTVFRVEVDGDIELGPEIQEYIWWDRAEGVPLIDNVAPILDRCEGLDLWDSY